MPAMVQPDAYTMWRSVAMTSVSMVLKTPVFESIQYRRRGTCRKLLVAWSAVAGAAREGWSGRRCESPPGVDQPDGVAEQVQNFLAET